MKAGTSVATAPTLQIPLFVALWFLIEFIVVGRLALAFIPLFLGGFIVWWFTTRRASIAPHKVIVPYLLTVIAFIVLVHRITLAFFRGDVRLAGQLLRNTEPLDVRQPAVIVTGSWMTVKEQKPTFTISRRRSTVLWTRQTSS